MGEAFITRRGGGKVELKAISVTTPPTKTDYIAGEVFDPAGMVVMADLGGVSIAASGYTVTPTVMAAGTTSVTISYTFDNVTKATTQPVTVKTLSSKTLSSIAITTQPNQTDYVFGESFNPAGMVVTATYSDGSTSVVTGWTYAPTGSLTHTNPQVTVSYTYDGVTKTATPSYYIYDGV